MVITTQNLNREFACRLTAEQDAPYRIRALLMLLNQLTIGNLPAVSEKEAIALLQCHNGITHDLVFPREHLSRYIADNVWLASGDTELARRLRKLSPDEAAALFTSIELWWGSRSHLVQHEGEDAPFMFSRFFLIKKD